MKSGAFAGLALHPDLSTQQLSEAFGDSQAQASPAIVASRRGINLLKRFEQAVLPLQGNADPSIAHREMEQPFLRMAKKIGVRVAARFQISRAARGGRDLNDHLAVG